ncbi:MAG: TraR/DksA C4-type zinc finger protein [Phycisphaerae bacterium]
MADDGKKSNDKKSGVNGKISASGLEHFKKLLLEKRRDLIGDVSEMHDEALRDSRMDAAGDLSAMPIHMADIGSDTYEQELALGLMDGERKLLRQIDEALERIYNGTYGICQGTGKIINKARLKAKPWAKYSVEYARLVETGQAPGEPQ